MNNYIPLFYVDVITYPRPDPVLGTCFYFQISWSTVARRLNFIGLCICEIESKGQLKYCSYPAKSKINWNYINVDLTISNPDKVKA